MRFLLFGLLCWASLAIAQEQKLDLTWVNLFPNEAIKISYQYLGPEATEDVVVVEAALDGANTMYELTLPRPGRYAISVVGTLTADFGSQQLVAYSDTLSVGLGPGGLIPDPTDGVLTVPTAPIFTDAATLVATVRAPVGIPPELPAISTYDVAVLEYDSGAQAFRPLKSLQDVQFPVDVELEAGKSYLINTYGNDANNVRHHLTTLAVNPTSETPYQPAGVIGASNPVRQPDGTFQVDFTPAPLDANLRSNFDTYRLSTKPITSNTYSTVDVPVSSSTIPVSLPSDGVYEYRLEAISSTTGNSAVLGGPSFYTIQSPATLPPQPNNINIQYPPFATGSQDVTVNRFDDVNQAWQTFQTRRNVPQNDFPVEFRNVPDGHYVSVVQGAEGGQIGGYNTNTYGTVDLSRTTPLSGFNFNVRQPFTGSGDITFPPLTPQQIAQYPEWAVQYGGNSIRVPTSQQSTTLTNLDGNTPYDFRLSLLSNTGSTIPTPPVTIVTPSLVTVTTPPPQLGTIDIRYPPFASGPQDVSVYQYDSPNQRWTQFQQRRNVPQNDFDLIFDNVPSGYYTTIVQGTDGGPLSSYSTNTFGPGVDTSTITPFNGFNVNFPPPFSGSGSINFPTLTTQQKALFPEWTVQYGGRTIRVPTSQSTFTVPNLTGDTLYDFSLSLVSPTGSSTTPTPPVSIRTPSLAQPTVPPPTTFNVQLPSLVNVPTSIRDQYNIFGYTVYRWNEISRKWETTTFGENSLSASQFPKDITLPEGYYSFVWSAKDVTGIDGFGTTTTVDQNFVGERPFLPSIGGGEWVFFPQGSTYDFKVQGITQDILTQYNQIVVTWTNSGGQTQSTAFPLSSIDQTVTLPSSIPDGEYNVAISYFNTATGTFTTPSAGFDISFGQVTLPRGPSGPKGMTGMDGPAGPNGPKGFSGGVGLPGMRGMDGTNGFDGSDGPPGPPGPSGGDGERGFQGNPGPPGQGAVCRLLGSRVEFPCPEGWATRGSSQSLSTGKGPVGPPGPQGPTGPRGASGLEGPQGSEGHSGDQGESGPPGPKGPPGVPGPNGGPGSPGKDGFPGGRGPEGAVGTAGQLGPPGRQGAQGSLGHAGEKGHRGHNGKQGRHGYDGQKGVRGDQGRNGKTGLHGRDGLTGPLGGRGAPGLSGNRGAAGRPGNTGRQGGDGPLGAAGAVGFPGIKGEKGDLGLTGFNGQRGANGKDGQAGAKGAFGRPGTPGTGGSGGTIGFKGIKGSGGTVGEPGAHGSQGEAGPDGSQGRKGAGGDNGLTGSKGPKGEQGGSGQAGISGGPGLEGDVGVQGRMGNQGRIGRSGALGLPGSAGVTGGRGELGPSGHKGETGGFGSRGDSGGKGSRGDRAQDGPQGRSGRQGPPGRDGEPGVPGRDGIPATDGKDGRTGPAGSMGSRGEKGDQGPEGGAGVVGDAGENGLPGADGRNGAKGKKGDVGDVGLDGLTGDDGPQGPKGVQGGGGGPGGKGEDALSANQGTRGPKGLPGSRGRDGRPGSKGQPGSSGLSGSDALAGDTGPPGADGGIGNPGRNGAQGTTGVSGNTGSQGGQGPAGSPGPTGSAGLPGSAGVPGINGDPGSNGNEGPEGPAGDRGSIGQKGLQGNSGFPGIGGEVGAPGPSGDQGSRGISGQSGLEGAGGTAGPAGEPGADGRNGEAGLRGARGEAGATGPAGQRGSAGTQGSGGRIGQGGISGDSGPKGARGELGTLGNGGPRGPTGIDGVNGRDGEAGQKGDRGIAGGAGPKGFHGDRAMKGPNGRPGAMGINGKDGQLGMVGEQGGMGASGSTGPRGVTGAGGDKGARGRTGSAGGVGESGPGGDHGAAGKPGGPGSEGRSGSKGPSGPTGEPGRAGERGVVGRAGKIGPTGEPGPGGLSGPSGPPGPPGRDGIDGATGPDGAVGPSGADGLPGTGGSAGLPGRPGFAGPDGAAGDLGFDGELGNEGPRGLTGADGLHGPPGGRGEEGSSGIKGERGPVGPLGAAGPTGPSGMDGARGTDGMRGEPGKDGSAGRNGPTGSPGSPGTGWVVSGKGKASSGKGTTFYAGEESFDTKVAEFSCYFTPNGSRQCPVRCCFDLFQDYPEYPSGLYYTNPGLGSPNEAVLTQCNKENMETCVTLDSQNASLPTPYTRCGCQGSAQCQVTCSSRPPMVSKLAMTMADETVMTVMDVTTSSEGNTLSVRMSGSAELFPVKSWNLDAVCPDDGSATAFCDQYCFN